MNSTTSSSSSSPSSENLPRSLGLDGVNVNFLIDTKKQQRRQQQDPSIQSTSTLSTSSPIVITPRWDDSLQFLTSWLVTNRQWVEEQMLQYGAVYIRGFDIHTPVEFETAVSALQPDLSDAYRGTSPRSLKPGCQYAFSAADVPVNFPIAQHCEMSMLKAPPRQLYFGCMKASTQPGGETSLCDFRKVYQDLNPTLREKLRTKQLKYTRTHTKIGQQWTYDVGAMLGWPQLFDTSNPHDVERICMEEDAPAVQWIGPNNDTFYQEWIDSPFQSHPVTGETVWFNHSQVFHWTTFSMELLHSFTRIKDIHLILHFVLVSIFCFVKYGLLGYDMALNTTFGDGTPITFWEMNEIRRAIHKNMIYSRWQEGDILAIDNFSTSHGRQPTYDRSREVIVAWSQPCNKYQKQQTIDSNATVGTKTVQGGIRIPSRLEKTNVHPMVDESAPLPALVEATPNSSAESTMTKDEANQLKERLWNDHFQTELSHALSAYGEKKKNVDYHSHGHSSLHKRQSSCPALTSVFAHCD